MSPEVTLERIRPFFEEAGLTRVGDVTGLDTPGIPVAVAVRPNARSLSVSQGKGVTLAAAKVSAAMEALELFHAEHLEVPSVIASVEELRARKAPMADSGLLARRVGSVYRESLRIPWVTGQGVVSGDDQLVPTEMVDMDCVRPRPYTTHVFYGGSNGLASGNCRQEAVAHALCELVERDAKALWWHRGRVHHDRTRIDPSSVSSAAAVELLDRFDRAGVDVALWNLTSDLGIPTVRAMILDRSPFGGRRLMVNGGQGCHPDAEVAVRRALTEAAQSRLTAITASRDDITRKDIAEATDERLHHKIRRELFGESRQEMLDFGTIASHRHATLEEDIALLLGRIDAAGLPEPVAVDLSRPGWPMAVVKAVGPGLEPNPAERVVHGERARRALEEAAR